MYAALRTCLLLIGYRPFLGLDEITTKRLRWLLPSHVDLCLKVLNNEIIENVTILIMHSCWCLTPDFQKYNKLSNSNSGIRNYAKKRIKKHEPLFYETQFLCIAAICFV
ncbi:hypothetical protein RF11_14395 [Thelohanellus kitauei]|uniref:Uncharacterized protein n=1 Tax=Thelohanellus kitauei TaxID=669202 RepID=A0A0C2MUX2_THEKT|nr:hypothetical protein RF11_14395 [Thelohanellus kitauei]